MADIQTAIKHNLFPVLLTAEGEKVTGEMLEDKKLSIGSSNALTKINNDEFTHCWLVAGKASGVMALRFHDDYYNDIYDALPESDQNTLKNSLSIMGGDLVDYVLFKYDARVKCSDIAQTVGADIITDGNVIPLPTPENYTPTKKENKYSLVLDGEIYAMPEYLFKAFKENQYTQNIKGYEVTTVEPAQENQILLPPRKIELVRCSTITPKKKDYLIYPFFQRNRLALVGGEAGSAKTQLILKLTAIFSSGEKFWIEDAIIDRQPMVILYVSSEDGVDDTLKPRLMAMNANQDNIYFIDNTKALKPIEFSSVEFRNMVDELRPEVIMFDPLQGYVEDGVDLNKAGDVRKQVIYLSNLAEKLQFTPIGIVHPNKNKNMSAADRISGSKELVNVARSVLYVGRDPDNDLHYNVAMAKTNGPRGHSFAFSIEQLGFDEKGFSVIGDLKFEGLRSKTADQIASGISEREKGSPKADEAKEILQELLRTEGGKIKTGDVKDAAEQTGISYTSFKRAKEGLGLKTENTGKVYYWIREDNEVG